MSTAPTSPLRKFQDLLRELFQFDCADLDFGIYRIMNHKRDVVEEFIAVKLPESIDAELGRGMLAHQAEANAALQEARQQLVESLGADAINPAGDVQPALAGTPVARTYLDARSRSGTNRSRAALESDVYNWLYTFFSRYYQDGDFISKRRYSGNHRYAIPYNGEEVYLHWANSDQYYIKTEEHFHSYQWKSPTGVSVRFHVNVADVEQNNVKSDRRFFLPSITEATWDASDRRLDLPFAYRPLSKAEQADFGSSGLQEKIIARTVAELPRRFDHADVLAALTSERRRDADSDPMTHLEHHLRQYTRRNDSDFFIHKDIRGFLSRELDFFLKNEVLNLDDLADAGEPATEGWFQLLRLVKLIGGQIIDFLAQIEGFQKTLWEKRKFVWETNYCIAVRCVPTEFHAEIAANEPQWEEWRALALVNDSGDTLFDSCETRDERIAYLKMNGTLMVDTAHFDVDFTDRLLASLHNLDGLMDGLVIDSENSQALRFLRGRYEHEIQSVYIDPPYNTDASAILYKNGYKNSSWLSLMSDGLASSRTLLKSSGVVCCAIDDEEGWRLRSLMQATFDRELGVVAVRSNPAGRKSRGQFSPAHEYAFFFGAAESAPGSLRKTKKELDRYPFEDERGRFAWNNLIRHGSNDRREDRPKMFFPIYVHRTGSLRVPDMDWDDDGAEYRIKGNPTTDEVAVWPIRFQDGEKLEKNWHRGPERVSRTLDQYRVRRAEASGRIEIDFKIYLDTQSMPRTWWDDSRYASANLGARAMKDLFGDRIFDFPKAVDLVADCLRAAACDEGATALDYFAGSGTTGHAVVNMNRDDGGQRKFILIEMGRHFDTVMLPRLKKITFCPDWNDGRPSRAITAQEADRSPRLIKYVRLESYEDALDSIEFDERAGQLKLENSIDGYLLKYMLKWETKDSETLLNPAKLANPFDYRLRVHANGDTVDRPVDLAETFNYLLGLEVKTRKVYIDEDRRYLVFRGETREEPGRATVVIWRNTAEWTEADLKRDKAFVADCRIMADADTVYANGLCAIVGARPIEPLFKERMFADVRERA